MCRCRTDQFVAKDLSPTLPKDVTWSQPYWLRKPATLGTFAVDDQKLIGLPENPPPFPVEVALRVGDQDLRYMRRHEIPHASIRSSAKCGRSSSSLRRSSRIYPNPVFVFGDDKPKSVQVRVTASTGAVRGELRLEAPKGWRDRTGVRSRGFERR